MDEFEEGAYGRGFSNVAGLDEAGRGPLAGPVVAAAVIPPVATEIQGSGIPRSSQPNKEKQSSRK